jgi:hypothetical protein
MLLQILPSGCHLLPIVHLGPVVCASGPPGAFLVTNFALNRFSVFTNYVKVRDRRGVSAGIHYSLPRGSCVKFCVK